MNTVHERRIATENALQTILHCVEQPRAIWFRPAEQAAVREAVERVSVQLVRGADHVLTIALAGGSGAGKSTLINALAGALIAEVAEQRPCTMQATVYHHAEVSRGGLPAELAEEARFVAHQRPELRFKVIVDTPDLDTFATQNRAATRAMLKAAGLVLYLFTPERYWEERVWTVIREEQRFSGCAAVLNKSDTAAPHELERAADEIRRRFVELGISDIPLLRVCAARHVTRADGTLPPDTRGGALIDEFASLRAYIENELREGDIARMRRQQRVSAVENLAMVLEAALPGDMVHRLGELERAAASNAERGADRLAGELTAQLAATELELRPLVNVRRHQRFFGPLRVWLAIGDTLTVTLPRLARRFRWLGAGEPPDAPSLIAAAPVEATVQAVRRWADEVRDQAHALNLPVERWRKAVPALDANELTGELITELQGRFEAAGANPPRRFLVTARVASVIGWLIPMGVSIYALGALAHRMMQAQLLGGFDVLALVVTVIVLSFTLLHGFVTLAQVGTGPPPLDQLGKQCLRQVFHRRLGAMVRAYCAAIEADRDDLQQPLERLRTEALTPIQLPEPAPGVSGEPARATDSGASPARAAPVWEPAPVVESVSEMAAVSVDLSARTLLADRTEEAEAARVEREAPEAPSRGPGELLRDAVRRRTAALRGKPESR